MSDTVWSMLADNRRAFIDYVETLNVADWERPSLCAGWSVRDVIAHCLAGAQFTVPSFITGLITSGFSFEKMTARGVQRERDGSPAEIIARFRPLIENHTQPGSVMLGEIVVHSEDIRRGLGGPAGQYPEHHLVVVADTYKKAGPPMGVTRRIKNLQLRATDANWSYGNGPEVTGPLLSLILAMTGRPAGLAELDGEGKSQFSRQM